MVPIVDVCAETSLAYKIMSVISDPLAYLNEVMTRVDMP
jgi:hypothetical protein